MIDDPHVEGEGCGGGLHGVETGDREERGQQGGERGCRIRELDVGDHQTRVVLCFEDEGRTTERQERVPRHEHVSAGLRVEGEGVEREALRVGVDVESAAVAERRVPVHASCGDVDQGDAVGRDGQQRSRGQRGASTDADTEVDGAEHVRERIRIHRHHAFGNAVGPFAIPSRRLWRPCDDALCGVGAPLTDLNHSVDSEP